MSKKHKQPGFNSPFAQAEERLAALVPPPPPPPPPKATGGKKASATGAAATAQTRHVAPVSDDELFADHMTGVAPIIPDPRGRLGAPPAPATTRTVSRRAEDEAEAYAQLADLVDGFGPFSVSDTDEYLEFLAPGIDRRLLRKLRAGEYSLQGHVDLHGMTRDQARAAVERLIENSRLAQHRCVLIVHGRGLNSKDQIPVLKEAVKSWLAKGRLGRQVLAFASARPCDGGAGALYVLLRR